jgi:hypothetical protein
MPCGFAKIRKKNWMERVFLDGDFIASGGGILGYDLKIEKTCLILQYAHQFR